MLKFIKKRCKNKFITTHELGKIILNEGIAPTPIYHGKGYKRGKKTIKFQTKSS